MNRILRFAALAALPALLLSSCAQQENVTVKTDASLSESNQEIASAKPWDKPQRMMESMQYRYDKWADPVTGEIDYRNYYKALAQADRIAQGPSTKANFDLSWDALGLALFDFEMLAKVLAVEGLLETRISCTMLRSV